MRTLKSYEEIPNLTSDAFQKLKSEDPNGIILDVRTEEEFRNVRLTNSILIDIYKPDFIEKISLLDKSKSYFIYCASGVRSLNACKEMRKRGFEKVYNLEYGIHEWDGEVENG